MIIKNSSRALLLTYVVRQLNQFFPDDKNNALATVLEQDFDQALQRLNHCINAVKMWSENVFDYLHSSQYTTFLYYLANTIWRNQKHTHACTKLFYLNKALNGIDCFYEVNLPDIFFIGHSVGIVLAKAEYSNYFVIYQNSTVGKNHGVAPTLDEGVVMYPNTAIIGRAHVKARTVIAQGVRVINQNTPGHCLAFDGVTGELIYKPLKRDIITDIFRV